MFQSTQCHVEVEQNKTCGIKFNTAFNLHIFLEQDQFVLGFLHNIHLTPTENSVGVKNVTVMWHKHLAA